MTILEAVILGVVQGLTEFLPVSSSGHLMLGQHVLGLQLNEVDMQGINVLLHAGTLLALLCVYAKTWCTIALSPLNKDKEAMHTLVLLIVATIPGALAGLFAADTIAAYLQSPYTIGIAFACTAAVLIAGETVPTRSKSAVHRFFHRGEQKAKLLTSSRALLIGFAQALALVPGLSRSGLTISAGRASGLTRSDALDFSFLMAVPIIAGASLVTVFNVHTGSITLPTLAVSAAGFACSFGASLGAVLFLRSFVLRRSLAWFAPYLLILSAITLLSV